jgi:enolase
MNDFIESVRGRRVWDSRGCPTVEVDVTLEDGVRGRAIAPAGASRGRFEAVDLRDGGAALRGLDVQNALAQVNGPIASLLIGRSVTNQADLDRLLIDLDGTPNKSRLGGNAMIATSMAIARARAAHEGLPLWKSLAGARRAIPPLPEIQIFGGGAHAAGRLDVQDFMVIATGAETFSRALEMTADVYAAAGSLMSESGRLAGVADEGGFWPMFDTNEAALDMLVRAIERAGYRPLDEVAISLDVAASEFHVEGGYRLARESRTLSTEEMIDMLLGWVGRYPIISIEDPLGETDEAGLVEFTRRAGPALQIVGDDFLVTNADRVYKAQRAGACNAALIKPNQAGTLTETQAALNAAIDGGWGAIVSARSGETEDTTIAHLAVGWGARQLKVGSFARSERMAKWNEVLRIVEEIGDGGALPPRGAFPWGGLIGEERTVNADRQYS